MPPFWLPVLAGVPIGACMLVMALPTLGNARAAVYRGVFLLLFLVWLVPLTALQRELWRRRTRWWSTMLILLAVTCLMGLTSNLASAAVATLAHWQAPTSLSWTTFLRGRGLDGLWLALVAFCACHALVAIAVALQHEQARGRAALHLARETQLRALRYQLHPHFLYNTLNAISALVADQRPGQAQLMIAKLGSFLRATLEDADTDVVTLADELALLDSYLDIEKARFGDRLVLRVSLGEQTLSALIPRLLLQPLVENAIRHGIAHLTEPGRLSIDVQRDADQLWIVIRNDGPSIAPEHVSGIGTGLRNVEERLRASYPGAYTFDADAQPSGGFAASIRIPCRTTPPVVAEQAA